MNFESWFSQLQQRTAPYRGVGKQSYQALLNRLGNPQQAYKIVHVAGTNGKGSVCTLLAHTLSCAGSKTGLFISPHLLSPTERICIDGVPIAEDDFIAAVQTVLTQEREKLNFFEVITAAAFIYFAQQKVEYAVLETGLGGEKDPTNSCNPVLCLITSIGLDHTALLGTTLTEIAQAKAGIIKPQVPVICADVPLPAVRVIEQTVLEKNAPLMWVREGMPFYTYAYDFANGYTLLHTINQEEWFLHLLGTKQTQNACLVYQAALQLNVPIRALQQAFQTVQIWGRFEQIKTPQTTFILDGAHNPQAIAALVDFWQKTPYAGKSAALLCGFMKDKNRAGMWKILEPNFASSYITCPPSPRAAGPSDLQPFTHASHVHIEPNLRIALEHVAKFPVVLCTGSFYLVGAVKAYLPS